LEGEERLEHPPLELTTERCILKKFGPENARDLFAIYGDEETMKYMQKPCVKSVEECAELLEKWDDLFSRGVSFRWGVFLKENQSRMIGTAALHYWSRENRRIELGADLHRDYHRRGLITEVTSRIIDYAFSDLGVNRIELRCHPDNTGSVVIAGKFGFKHEGILRQYVFVPGKGLVDEAVYSLLADER
jgi:ribosomal-protein-alanine N-acetyltransferase